MGSYVLIGLIISLLVAVVTYIVSNNLVISLIIFLAYILYFFIIGLIQFKKYRKKISRCHDCYRFINTFVVSLSIKQSIKSAYETTLNVMSEDFHRDLKGIDDLNETEKLSYICKYFKFHIYGLFIDLINLWSEQGGDIIDMSSYLINESRLVEEYINESESLSLKKTFEFATLWIFTLVILIVLRFSLGDFYAFLSKQIYFPIIIGTFMLFVLITIHIAMTRLCKVEIKGWYDEK